MSIGSYIVRVAGGAEKDIVAAVKTSTAYIDNVIVTDIEPPLENFFSVIVPAEVAVLKPYAVQALADVGADLPTLLAGGWAPFAAVLTPALVALGAKAASAGITVAKTDGLAALASVVADAQTTLDGVATTVSTTTTTIAS